MKALLAAAAALLALVGCSSAKDAQTKAATITAASRPATTASSAATPLRPAQASSSTPAVPAVWSKEQAGQRYLALAKPVNTLTARWNDNIDSASLSSARKMASDIAAAEDRFARGLTAGLWPTNAKAPAAELARYILKARIAWQTVAKSDTLQEAYDGSYAPVLTDPSAPAAATAVRIALGLRSN